MDTEIQTLSTKTLNLLNEFKVALEEHNTFLSEIIQTHKKNIVLFMNEKNLHNFEEKLTQLMEFQHYFPVINGYISKIIDNIKITGNKPILTKTYITLVFNTLQQHINNFKHQKHTLQNIRTFISELTKETKNPNNLNILYDNLYNIEAIFNKSHIHIIDSLSMFDYFEYIKDTTKHIVIIGANGAGKTMFSRQIKIFFDKNIAIIAAQKVFNCTNPNSLPIGATALSNVHNFQSDPKSYVGNNMQQMSGDFQNLISALISEHIQVATAFHKNFTNPSSSKPESKLEKVMTIWNNLNSHRKMEYDIESSTITIFNEQTKYNFNNMSDGEKAIFYFIAHILLAKENSYIIIDEPENHLNYSVIVQLWDKLEKLRDDCQFIYLTHNLDFASSRINTTKLWCKSFTHPNKWDIQPIPEDDCIPESLVMELLGCRKKILFCESEGKNGYDYKLYSLLFPNFIVIPAKGHMQVIFYTRAFNSMQHLTGNSSIGIIDGDYFCSEQIEKYYNDNIYVIPTQEVENTLCDEDLLIAAKEQYHAEDDSIEKIKKLFFNKFNSKKCDFAIKFTTQSINNKFKENMLKEDKTIEILTESIENLQHILRPKEIYKNKLDEYEQAISEKDYDKALRLYNEKGVISFVIGNIEKGYPTKVFKLLENNPHLINKLKDKYFNAIKDI